jgi:hypothetical protein
MKRIGSPLIAILLSFTALPANAASAGEPHPATQQEKDFYASVVVPTLSTVRKAMPRAPEGWVVENESPIAPALPDPVTGEPGSLNYSYSITYKRVAGVQEETKRLGEAYAEIAKKSAEAAKSRLDELAGNQAEAEQSLKKAQKHKEIGRERRLKKELEEIDRKLKALAQETERKTEQEIEQFLVKDFEVVIRVFLNESSAEFPGAKAFSRPKAAFALRKEGERIGAKDWKEAQTLILYGEWQEVRLNTFRASMAQKPYWPKPQTITIAVAGERTRTDHFLKQTDLRSLLELMK